VAAPEATVAEDAAHVMPVTPEQVMVIAPVNPPDGVTVTVELPLVAG
jgi:hypothetical protein